jgi:hypothetical protein
MPWDFQDLRFGLALDEFAAMMALDACIPLQ